jgi:hypothetical protein
LKYHLSNKTAIKQNTAPLDWEFRSTAPLNNGPRCGLVEGFSGVNHFKKDAFSWKKSPDLKSSAKLEVPTKHISPFTKDALSWKKSPDLKSFVKLEIPAKHISPFTKDALNYETLENLHLSGVHSFGERRVPLSHEIETIKISNQKAQLFDENGERSIEEGTDHCVKKIQNTSFNRHGSHPCAPNNDRENKISQTSIRKPRK